MTSKGPSLEVVPAQDLLTFLFSQQDQPQDRALWTEAADPARSINRSQALTLVRRLSHTYTSRNILDPSLNHEQYVVTVTENQPLGFVHALAIIASGGVVATCPWQATRREILHRIDILRPKAVVCSKLTVETVVAARHEARQDFKIIVHDTGAMTVCDDEGESLLSDRERAWHTDWNNYIANRTAAVVFSSGTTGSPKAVSISHANIIAMICQLRQLWKPFLQHKTKEVMLGCLDNAHVAGLFLNTFCSLGVGLETVLAPARDVGMMLKAFEQRSITIFPTVPAVLQRILASPKFRAEIFRDLKFVCTGAAKTPDEVKTAFSRVLSQGVFCQEAWGMTEITFLATMHSPGVRGPWNSIGKALAGNKVQIRDGNQAVVDSNCEGEIYVAGPTVTPGYLRANEVDRENFTAGWLRTGDMGRIDNEGYVYVTGRNKELIKYNGTQVAPAELEALRQAATYVLDAAVVGMEMDDGNELPTAFVVLADDAPATALRDIARAVEQQVSPYKKLRGGVHAAQTIPRNAMGKPLLAELKAISKAVRGTLKAKAKI